MNTLAPYLLAICLIILNCGVLLVFQSDRESFKNSIERQIKAGHDDLSKDLVNMKNELSREIDLSENKSFSNILNHAEDTDLHMKYDQKLALFMPRIVAEEKFNIIDNNFKEVIISLDLIKKKLETE